MPAKASKKRKEPVTPPSEGDDDTTINYGVAMFKLLKHYQSGKTMTITVKAPFSNMELYFMIQELVTVDKYTLPGFITACEKEHVRIPPRAQLLSLQSLAYSKFTVRSEK